MSTARHRLYRLVSLLKVRDGDFNLTLHEYATSDRGLIVDANSDSAERIMIDYASQMKGALDTDRPLRPKRSR